MRSRLPIGRSPWLSAAFPGGKTSDLNGTVFLSPDCATPRPAGNGPLYWRDRNLKFHRYDLIEPTANVTELLTEIDRDPTGIFWG